ncbi:unnamed protein product [Schistosoma turkestanicum]|nr:unnamed protein product [Schistosoma turkestanicum]
MNIIIESTEQFIKDTGDNQTTLNLSIQTPYNEHCTLNSIGQTTSSSFINTSSSTSTIMTNSTLPLTTTTTNTNTTTNNNSSNDVFNYSNLINMIQSQSFNPMKSFYENIEQIYENLMKHQQLTSFSQYSQQHEPHEQQTPLPVNHDLNRLIHHPPSLGQTATSTTSGMSNQNNNTVTQINSTNDHQCVQCFICHQSIVNDSNETNNDLENLVKHLTMQHMLPLPIVMNYVIGYMNERGDSYNNTTSTNDTTTNTTTTNSTLTVKPNQNIQFMPKLNIDPLWDTMDSNENNALPFHLTNVLYKDSKINQLEVPMHLKSTYPDQISPSHQTQSSLTTTMATITQPSLSNNALDLHSTIHNQQWFCSQCNQKFPNIQQFHLHFTQIHHSSVSELNTLNFIGGNMMNNNNTSTTNSLLPSSSLSVSSTGIQSKPMNHNTLLTNNRSMLTGNNHNTNNSSIDSSIDSRMPIFNDYYYQYYDWLKSNYPPNALIAPTNFTAFATAAAAAASAVGAAAGAAGAYNEMPSLKQIEPALMMNEFNANLFHSPIEETLNTIVTTTSTCNTTHISNSSSINSSICSISMKNNRNQIEPTERRKRCKESLYPPPPNKPCLLSEAKTYKI